MGASTELSMYIAGSSRELDRVEAVVAYARSLDLVITFDWTVDVRATAALGKTDRDLTARELQRHALRDQDGVRRARVLVLLAPVVPTTGAWWELGIAFALGKRVVVSREQATRLCIGEVLAGYEAETDVAAVALAKQLMAPLAVDRG